MHAACPGAHARHPDDPGPAASAAVTVPGQERALGDPGHQEATPSAWVCLSLPCTHIRFSQKSHRNRPK